MGPTTVALHTPNTWLFLAMCFHMSRTPPTCSALTHPTAFTFWLNLCGIQLQYDKVSSTKTRIETEALHQSSDFSPSHGCLLLLLLVSAATAKRGSCVQPKRGSKSLLVGPAQESHSEPFNRMRAYHFPFLSCAHNGKQKYCLHTLGTILQGNVALRDSRAREGVTGSLVRHAPHTEKSKWAEFELGVSRACIHQTAFAEFRVWVCQSHTLFTCSAPMVSPKHAMQGKHL